MTDISSVASSTAAFFTKQTADLSKAASSATTSFASTLSSVQTAIVGRPKTGFTAGPTYEATTLSGQTQAAINHTVNTVKSALHLK